MHTVTQLRISVRRHTPARSITHHFEVASRQRVMSNGSVVGGAGPRGGVPWQVSPRERRDLTDDPEGPCGGFRIVIKPGHRRQPASSGDIASTDRIIKRVFME
jgi:hypothetical protein